MTGARMFLVGLMWLMPTAVLAHGADGHPADPNLHVDPSLKDCSVEFAPNLTQAAFARFAREFGSVSAFKTMSPPTTLGKGRIAVGIEEMSFSVEEKSSAWNDTFAHPNATHELGSTHVFPKLRLRMGVTDDIDVGAFYTRNPNANYGWLGLEVKYRMPQPVKASPTSLSLRGAYTRTLYVHDMNMNAFTADVAAARTFRNVFTSYVGVGSDLVLARETSDAVRLHSETQLVPHVLGGFQVRYWRFAFGAEANLAALTSVQGHITTVL